MNEHTKQHIVARIEHMHKDFAQNVEQVQKAQRQQILLAGQAQQPQTIDLPGIHHQWSIARMAELQVWCHALNEQVATLREQMDQVLAIMNGEEPEQEQADADADR